MSLSATQEGPVAMDPRIAMCVQVLCSFCMSIIRPWCLADELRAMGVMLVRQLECSQCPGSLLFDRALTLGRRLALCVPSLGLLRYSDQLIEVNGKIVHEPLMGKMPRCLAVPHRDGRSQFSVELEYEFVTIDLASTTNSDGYRCRRARSIWPVLMRGVTMGENVRARGAIVHPRTCELHCATGRTGWLTLMRTLGVFAGLETSGEEQRHRGRRRTPWSYACVAVSQHS